MRRQSLDGQVLERDRLEDAGVAHHGVDAAELVEGASDDRLAALGRVDGVVRRDRRAAGASDLVDHVVGDAAVRAVARHRAAEVVDDDRRASSREVEGVEPPEAAPRPGHHDGLVVEPDHAADRTGGWRGGTTVRFSRRGP